MSATSIITLPAADAEVEGIEVVEIRATDDAAEDAQADLFAAFLLDAIRALGERQIARRLSEVRGLRASAMTEMEALLDEEVRLAGMLARIQGVRS